MKFKLVYLTSIFFVLLNSCEYNDLEVDCAKTDLQIRLDAEKDPTKCNTTDGSITVSATGAEKPYTFSVTGVGLSNTTGVFTGLGVGTYTVNVKSARGCEVSTEVVLASTSTLKAIATPLTNDTDCFSGNGSFKITASLGNAPYQFQFQQSTFKKSTTGDTTISNLKSGNYIVIVKDATDCTTFVNVLVASNTGISYTNTIKTIIETRCSITGCHNGDNGATRNWTIYDLVKANAANIKGRTTRKEMPPAEAPQLTTEQIAQIVCWVNDGALKN
jgi:SprB repeat